MSNNNVRNQYTTAEPTLPSTPLSNTQSSSESSLPPSPASIDGQWKLVVQSDTEIIWHRTIESNDEWLTAAVSTSGIWDFTHTRDETGNENW